MEWAIVLATFLGPILAVQAARIVAERKQAREERLQVFKRLMATRASALNPHHVEALNLIDVVFSSKNAEDTAIRESWKQYLDHLTDKTYPKETWGVKRIELLVDLLYLMAKTLGFSLDKTHIKNHGYYPVGYGEIEEDQTLVRKALLHILTGQRPLPVFVVQPLAQQPAIQAEQPTA